MTSLSPMTDENGYAATSVLPSIVVQVHVPASIAAEGSLLLRFGANGSFRSGAGPSWNQLPQAQYGGQMPVARKGLPGE